MTIASSILAIALSLLPSVASAQTISACTDNDFMTTYTTDVGTFVPCDSAPMFAESYDVFELYNYGPGTSNVSVSTCLVSNYSDSQLYLYQLGSGDPGAFMPSLTVPACTNLVARNDDGGAGCSSQLSFIPPTEIVEGHYTVVASNWWGTQVDTQDILITSDAPNDGIGLGDPCDPNEDQDSDGILDGDDSCPFVANADQADFDGDGAGDVCDDDDDNDGVLDVDDPYPTSEPAPDVVINGCDPGVGNLSLGDGSNFMDLIQACPTMPPGHFTSCVTQLANDWKDAGLITGKQKGKISTCAN